MVSGWESRELSPDETLAMLYSLALDVAEERGATIPPSARGSGAYAFLAEVRAKAGDLTITWEGQDAFTSSAQVRGESPGEQ